MKTKVLSGNAKAAAEMALERFMRNVESLAEWARKVEEAEKQAAESKLLPPPFPIGAKVEYIGNHSTWEDAQGTKPLLTKGMVFEIISTDKDGCSVYINPRGEKKLIHAKNKSDWKILE